MTAAERQEILARRKAGIVRSWADVGREDAQRNVFRPPTGQARASYQFAWEETAGDAAWKARMTGE